MHANGEQLFYQTNIVVLPTDSLEGPMTKVVGVVCEWLRQIAKGDIASVIRDEFDEELPGMAFPADYPGGAVDDERIGECLRTTFWGNRSQWALDYDKPDDREPLMRWHTSIGVDDLDGMCRVNIRVVVYMMSGYCGLFDPSRSINVPRVVSMLNTMEGVKCYCGGYPLTSERAPIIESTWERDFVDTLVSPNRKIPLILVCSSMDGGMPYDPETLAREFTGVALVFALDFSEPWVLKKIRETFPKNTAAKTWSPWESTIYLFQPGTDLSQVASRRKRGYYSEKTVDRYSDRQSFGRLFRNAVLRHSETCDEVYGTRDLEEGMQAELHKQELTILEGKVEKAERDADFYYKVAESYTTEERSQPVQDDRAELEKQISSIEQQLADAKMRSRYHQSRCEALEAKMSEAMKEIDHLKDALSTLDEMTHVPTRLSELLEVFEKVYSDRVVVLESARRSAREFDGKNPLDESFGVLRSMGTTLWDLYFRQEGCANIAEEFQNISGFELALHESDGTLTNKDARAQRTVRYKGKEVTAIKHIKGRNNAQGNAFRVYYEVDREERKIVITHCGKHLKTIGSQRRSIK